MCLATLTVITAVGAKFELVLPLHFIQEIIQLKELFHNMCFVIKEGFVLYIFDLRHTTSSQNNMLCKKLISRAEFRDSNGAELKPVYYSTVISNLL
jgi:hypothetical protein